MSMMRPAAALMVSLLLSSAVLAQEAPDTILVNGKIVTVDDYFSIQEAVAISGQRIAAVGPNGEIRALAGSRTDVVDLGGRTVIPGLIDNHLHIIRATEYWPNEARLDGVNSRVAALAILEDKVATLADGEWLMSLGGWTENQFIGNRDDFSLEELDDIAPGRPAFIQSTYDHAFVNSAWFQAMDIPILATRAERDAARGLASHVVRDETGRATGRMNGGIGMVAMALERFPEVSAERQAAAIKNAYSYLNGIGLTSVYDPAGVGISPESYARINALADRGEATVRIFHTLGGGVPSTPDEAAVVVEHIRSTRPFQGDELVDLIAVGEIYYGPFHWDSLAEATSPNAEDLAAARSILSAAAEGGWQVQTHASQPETINRLLDIMEDINQESPLRQLRWSVTHGDLVTPEVIERMRHLGMNLQLRSVSVLTQPRRYRLLEALGEEALHIPPLRMVQNSGLPWGLGTDGTKATQINPFVTLWWAVSGLALNGDRVLAETLTREEALIAHTRSNAYLMFQENNVGSIEPGLLADMLVLDRDYLTAPEAEIKDILPVATIFSGEVVWGEL
ncbi:MAG TPA: amidohydrolase family protein [Gammaproteobacteria bacterium]